MKSLKHLVAITDNVYHESIKTYNINFKSSLFYKIPALSMQKWLFFYNTNWIKKIVSPEISLYKRNSIPKCLDNYRLLLKIVFKNQAWANVM